MKSFSKSQNHDIKQLFINKNINENKFLEFPKKEININENMSNLNSNIIKNDFISRKIKRENDNSFDIENLRNKNTNLLINNNDENKNALKNNINDNDKFEGHNIFNDYGKDEYNDKDAKMKNYDEKFNNINEIENNIEKIEIKNKKIKNIIEKDKKKEKNEEFIIKYIPKEIVSDAYYSTQIYNSFGF